MTHQPVGRADGQLRLTADALRWTRREIVAQMNTGMSEGETLADVSYPDELFHRPWMRACVRPGPARRQRSK